MTAMPTFHPARLAAIVYDDAVAVDSLMTAFAREMLDKGVRASGILQLPPDGACGPGAPMRLQDVTTGEVIPICQDLGPGSKSCKLDLAALASASSRLRAAATGESDLLFISKFGKQEAEGRGFRAEFAFAVEHNRTILTAVKRGLVHRFFDFTGGAGTLLDHRLWVLRNWWEDLPPANTLPV